MITTKNILKEYLEQDKRQLGIRRKHPRLFADEIWKYQIILRKYEYWLNQKGLISKSISLFYKLKWHRKGIMLGIEIPPNTVGKGLSIAHAGCIHINCYAKVGENLRIHEGVTIGASGGNSAPQIGNNVFLGSGCKIIGDIKVADGVAVGAGSVVVKDIVEPAITVAGVPAYKVSSKDSSRFVFWYRDRQ